MFEEYKIYYHTRYEGRPIKELLEDVKHGRFITQQEKQKLVKYHNRQRKPINK